MSGRRKSRHDLPLRMYFNHGAYYFVDIHGKWHHLGRDKREALVRYSDLSAGPDDFVRLREVFDRYERQVLPDKAPKTQTDQKRQLARLRAVFGRMAPSALQPFHIYQYLDRRPPVAGQREKSLLSHVYSYAMEWAIVTENPCRDVRVRCRKRPPARYLTDDEYRKARERAPVPLGEAMDLAVITGLRLGDILSLRRQDCREDGLYITVSKTGVLMEFEWTPALRAAVDAALRMRSVASLYLICTRAGQRYTHGGFFAVWQRWQRTLGEHRFGFHDLRRKAAKDAEVALGREYARQLLGHAS